MTKSICVFSLLFLCGVTFGQPTTQTHPLYPLNIGDQWTYRNVDLKTPAGKKEVPKKTVVEVERQEIFTQKVVKDKVTEVTEHVGFIVKSTSGRQEKRDYFVLLEDGVRCVHRAETALTPPLNILKFPLRPNEKWDVNSTSGNQSIKGTYTWRRDSVNVPAGKFDAVVVLFSNNKTGEFERVEVETYYANKVGMVKQRILQNGHEHALELEKYVPKK